VTEFANELQNRVATARLQLQQARELDEPYLVDVHVGDLESLARIAADHGLVVEGLAQTLAETAGQ
jgi:hypothetical protein